MEYLLFFKEDIVIAKIIGALLIIVANVIVIFQKGKFTLNRYVLLKLSESFIYAIAVFIDVGISDEFNLPIYIAITLLVPAVLNAIFERISINSIKLEFKNMGNNGANDA